jgi:hypothetical protein
MMGRARLLLLLLLLLLIVKALEDNNVLLQLLSVATDLIAEYDRPR